MSKSSLSVVVGALLVGVLACLCVGQTVALTADKIRQGEAKQQQIKNQTQQVASQLGSIIEEFKRNGLDGDDVQVLGAIRSVLGKLSEKEMQRVIDLLQSARSVSDPGASRKHVAGAVTDQKFIVVQLRQLLLEYQRQQALYELSLRLAALAERQNGNLKVTVDLAKITQGRTGSQFDDNQRTSLQVQQAEQQALRDEANPLLSKLEGIARDSEGPTKDRLTKAMQLVKDSGLKPTFDSAIEDLKAGNLYRAAGSQKTIRDQLRELARLVAPPKDALAALKQAAAEIQKSIEQQKQLIDDTKKMDREREKLTPAELESRQADLVDKTDQTRKELQNIAPEAASQLKGAQEQMQEARADLNERRREPAVEKEKEALTKLEAAKSAVEEAIAKAEPAKEFGDKLAAAKELQARTRELIQKEEEIKQATKTNEGKQKELKAIAPKQGDVENQTRELQKDTAAEVPEAAQPMGDAAEQMDKSEKKLAKADDPKTAQEAQAAAIASLKQADEALGKRIGELEKAQAELAKLQDAREKVEKIIENQKGVELDTGKAAAAAAGAKELAEPQGKLARDTEQVRQEVADVAKDAAAPLGQAKQEMSDAKGKLEQNNAKGAQPPQKEAMADLFKAKDALDKRIEDLQKELGQEPQDGAALADAASRLEELKNDVGLAAEELAGDPSAMAKSLEEQQKDIAEALGEMSPDGGSPSEPLGQAKEAADKAAGELSRGQFAQAAKAMGQAQAGMQAAMKAQPAQQGEQAGADLPKLSKKQARLQKAAEQLASGQKPDVMQQAAQDLGEAAAEATDLAANDEGELPSGAAGAVEEAAQALTEAASAAGSANKPGAEASTAAAQAALAKASAALELAQAGLSGQMASAQAGQSQSQAQSKSPGQGKGEKPGKGQGKQGKKPGPATASRSTGNVGSRGGAPGEGVRRDEKGASAFIALPARDRAALTQSQSDKYPAEYAPAVEQYLRNLAEPDEK